MGKDIKRAVLGIISFALEIVITYIMWNNILVQIFPALAPLDIFKIFCIDIIVSWFKLRLDDNKLNISHNLRKRTENEKKEDEDAKLLNAITKVFVKACYLIITFICVILLKCV